MIPLYEASRISKFIDRKQNRGYQGTGVRRNEELLFNGSGVSVLNDEKVLEMVMMVCTTL